MACYKPLEAWSPFRGGAPYFGRRLSPADQSMKLKCGQCIGCRLDRSREWAIRCAHEAKYHEENCFLTLTFANDPVSLSHEYFQKFLKRLRFRFTGKRFRFYMCGEYGSQYDEDGNPIPGALGRPHFHAILFGHDFHDRYYWKQSKSGFPIYRSNTLDEVWQNGYAYTQDFSLESAAYVARYVTKKITGDQAENHYQKNVVDTTTGELLRIPVRPEYTRMSLRDSEHGHHGIGSRWIKENFGDCYPKDFVTEGGIKFKPPRYYDRLFELEHPDVMSEIKEKRTEHARRNAETPERLAVQEKCKQIQADRLIRE